MLGGTNCVLGGDEDRNTHRKR